jgi:hypothetical protein
MTWVLFALAFALAASAQPLAKYVEHHFPHKGV